MIRYFLVGGLAIVTGFFLGRKTEIISLLGHVSHANDESVEMASVTLAPGDYAADPDKATMAPVELRRQDYSPEAVFEWSKKVKGLTSANTSTGWLEMCRLMLEFDIMISAAGKDDLLSLVASERFSELDEMSIGMVYRRWAALDPKAAAAVWLDKFGEAKTENAISGVLDSWVREDAGAAVGWVEGLENEAAKKKAMTALIAPLAATNPALALKYITDLEGDWQVGYAAGALVKSMPPEQLPGAAEALKEKRDQWGNQQALQAFLHVWASQDADAAFGWVMSQDDLGSMIVTTTSHSFLAQTGDHAMVLEKLTPHLDKGEMVGQAAADMWYQWITSGKDDAGAIRWLRENAERLSFTQFQRHGRGNTAAEDVTRILGLVSELPEGSARTSMIQGLVSEMSNSDPQGALDYILEHLPPGGNSDNLISNALGNWAGKGEAEAAIQWAIDNLPKGDGRENALRNSISSWGRKDPLAAANFALKAGDSLPDNALSSLAYEWTRKDPDAVYGFIRQNADNPKVNSLAETHFNQVGQTGRGKEGLKDLLALSDGELRNESMRSLFRGWAYQDTNDAIRAIGGLEKGNSRDQAIRGLVSQLHSSDGEAAVAWSLEIGNAEARDNSVKSAATRWVRNDPAAAKRWIGNSNRISEEMKAELLK